jgi:hypothetical protein
MKSGEGVNLRLSARKVMIRNWVHMNKFNPLRSSIAACFAVLLLPGMSWSETLPEEDSSVRVEQTIAALEGLIDADSLAAAALLSVAGHREVPISRSR